MSGLDFERAEYRDPVVVDGFTGLAEEPKQPGVAAFPLAMVYGAVAAVVGAAVYALVGMTGIMVSIVVIGIGWLVGRAMMNATGGLGGRHYQIAAVIFTYLSASCGRLTDLVIAGLKQGYSLSQISPVFMVKWALFGPFLRLFNSPAWGAIGLLILFYGLRTAWQMAAGTPGFGTPGGPRLTGMGLRR